MELGKRVVLVLFAVAFNKNDYAILFALAIILALNGFFKPYKNMLVNILDVAFVIDIILLLSLRNTVDIEDALHILPEPRGEVDLCSEIQGHSSFVKLLASIYYIPVLLMLVWMGVWGTHLAWRFIKNDCIPLMEKKEEQDNNLETSFSPSISARIRTQTVIELSNCEDSSPKPFKGRKFSFRSKRASIKSASTKQKKEPSQRKLSGKDSKIMEEIELRPLSCSPGMKKKLILESNLSEPLITSSDIELESCPSSTEV